MCRHEETIEMGVNEKHVPLFFSLQNLADRMKNKDTGRPNDTQSVSVMFYSDAKAYFAMKDCRVIMLCLVIVW